MKKSTKKKSAGTGKRVTTKAKAKSAGLSAAADQDIVGLLTVLVQKLTAFESKLDMVLTRLPAGPVAAPKPQQQPPAIVPPQPRSQPQPQQMRPPRQMYKAVCADCGTSCEVPFQPREDRPVYCKECFAKRKAQGPFRPQQPVKPQAEPPVVKAAPVAKPKATAPAKAPKSSPKKKSKK